MLTLNAHVLRSVLALLVIVVSLAACGGDATPAEEAAPPTTDGRDSATGATLDSQSSATTTRMPEDSSGAGEIVQLLPFTSVTGGNGHTCAVDIGSSVVCWGDNNDGEAEAPAGSFISVSAGGRHTCGVDAGGLVVCWGDNDDGQATPPAGSFISVGAGAWHTCGLKADSSIACWGDNDDGQATALTGSFASVSAGGGHTCAVETSGSVACWGANEDGQATPPAGSFSSASSGEWHTCGVNTGGTVVCWGYDDKGQAEAPAGSFTSVSAGGGHTCAVDTGGTVVCWGANQEGQAEAPAGSFTSVSAGGGHTCGVEAGGSVVCWGRDFDGQAKPPSLASAQPSVTPTATAVDVPAGTAAARPGPTVAATPKLAATAVPRAVPTAIPKPASTPPVTPRPAATTVPRSTPTVNPDLVVHSASVSDRSVDAGEDFTFYATMENQGDGPSASTTLRLYRSDSVEPDMHPVAGLDAGVNREFSDTLTAPSSASGVYDYWACIDPVPRESNTQNNCSDTVSVTVRGRPDMAVHSASVSDSSVDAGEDFTFYAAVDNQGDGPSDSTTLRLYRSDSGELDMYPVDGLDAGVNREFSDTLTAPSSAGEFAYWACVDPVPRESTTQNNCSDTVSVTVRGRPDLFVHSASVSDSSVDAGERFTFYATVENQGDGPSDSTPLRYYMSGSRELDMDPVAGLDAGRAIDLSSIEVAPSSGSVYDYWACVDPVPRESTTQNNCSDTVSVTVRGRPDLFVHSASVSDSSVDAGERFTFYATVENQGDGPSGSTPLRYYMSGSRELDMDPVAGLDAGRAIDLSSIEVAPSSGSVYDYWACVDPVPRESTTQNNCSDTVSVTVRGKPDLVVRSVSVSDSSVDAGERFRFYATVENQGDGPSDSTALRYYRAGPGELEMYPVAGLDAGGAIDLSSIETTLSSAGEYDYWACVDSVPRESDTQNNCSDTMSVAVRGKPDLVVRSVSVSDSSVDAGERFTFYATVENQGDGPSDSTTLHLYRSDSVQPAMYSVDGLDAGKNREFSEPLTAPSSAREYEYWVCVDPVPRESDTQNNCSDRMIVAVRGKPDLIVHSASVWPNSVDAGERFTFYVTIENQGDGPSDSTALRYYRSGPGELQMYPGDGLDAGEAIDLSSIEVAPLSVGEYDYWACLDPVPRESDTQNNCSDRERVIVRGRPDLVVHSASVRPSSVDAGERFTFYATVENQGDGPSDSTALHYYSSGSGELDMDSVRGLDAGENREFSDSLTAPLSAGEYHYWACVDSVARESYMQNNCSDRERLTVRGRPDLVVHSASIWPNSVDAGERFTFWATVENQGDGPSDSSILRYYMSGSGELAMDSGRGLDAGENPEFFATLTAPSSAGEYDYWACVDLVPRESDTENNCSEDATLSVIVPASVDLVAELTSIEPGLPPTDDPDNVYAKAPLSLTATVTNVGNLTSSSTLLRYYVSTDSSIDPRHDSPVGESGVVSLGPNRKAEYSIGLRAPSNGGTWYYGVCVKKQPGNPDSVDDCSSGYEVGVLDVVWFDEQTIECYQYTSIIPWDLGARYRIQGTVVSRVALKSVTVSGYGIDDFDRSYTVGQDDLGSMSEWQRTEFSITGEVKSIYTHCEYELDFEHYS